MADATAQATKESQKRTTAHLEDALRSLEETNGASDATVRKKQGMELNGNCCEASASCHNRNPSNPPPACLVIHLVQLIELERQRRTLERTRGKVAEVEAQADYANWVLRGMSSWGGAVLNMVRGPPKPGAAIPASAVPGRGEPGRRPTAAGAASHTSSVADADSELLAGLESGLEVLESKHRHIRAELDTHSDLLDDIGKGMGHAQGKLVKASRAARRVV